MVSQNGLKPTDTWVLHTSHVEILLQPFLYTMRSEREHFNAV